MSKASEFDDEETRDLRIKLAAAEARIAELEEALRAAQETIGAFTDGRNRAEARIVELKRLKEDCREYANFLAVLADRKDSRIAELEAALKRAVSSTDNC